MVPIGLAPYNFLVCGLLVAALGGAAYGSYHFWEDGVTLAVGCWLVVSPWALKFRDEAVPGAIAIIAGGALALLAVWVLVAKRSQGLEKR
ncbi:SPW repeat protein [Rhizobium sp. BK376]|uniref:SPW repeat domain-containing protein n=1 Tax=Rhizobium sp. BK376 TaxID=2512149 RepID=UPI0010F0BA42|nr:SPW repeat protein [Rhizobium sp. BK376]TCR75615.1 SPW repeat-containing protein [Rhizobium sp. BK376]